MLGFRAGLKFWRYPPGFAAGLKPVIGEGIVNVTSNFIRLLIMFDAMFLRKRK
jgi:hypothetical protein